MRNEKNKILDLLFSMTILVDNHSDSFSNIIKICYGIKRKLIVLVKDSPPSLAIITNKKEWAIGRIKNLRDNRAITRIIKDLAKKIKMNYFE